MGSGVLFDGTGKVGIPHLSCQLCRGQRPFNVEVPTTHSAAEDTKLLSPWDIQSHSQTEPFMHRQNKGVSVHPLHQFILFIDVLEYCLKAHIKTDKEIIIGSNVIPMLSPDQGTYG